jgi:predicted Zn finger-like uncharacterized protein
MYAECPNCKTLFRVRQVQLEAARGKVRCGDCLVVFNALDSLRDDSGQPVASRLKSPTGNKPANREKRVPKLASDSQSKREPKAKPAPPLKQAPAAESEPGEYSLPLSAFGETRRGAGREWFLLSTLFFLTLVGQLLWFNQATLLENPTLRPLAESVCKVANCELAPPKDPSAFELTGLGVQTHPSYEGALLVDATFVNRGNKTFAHPDVELIFTDTENTPLFSRRFSPEEYLGKKPQQLVAPGAETHVVLELLDPGDTAVGYEFRFF